MKTIFEALKERLRCEESVVLVTVIASSGSTPRGSGARMLVGKDGRLCGTIGGGMVEYRSEQLAQKALSEKRSGTMAFTLTKDDVANLGMICGGDVTVYFQYFDKTRQDVIANAKRALRLLQGNEDAWIITDITEDGGSFGFYTEREGFFGITAPEELKNAMKRKPVCMEVKGRTFYIEQLVSGGSVYVFGCGHVAQELVPVLSHVNFRCIAMDDRPEFATKELFPTAEDVRVIDFGNIFESVSIGRGDYVIVMTRGHAFDTIVQEQVLKTPACYIGVIGSVHKKAAVFKILKEKGFTEKDLARITSPIGLDIMAETPAEIAISIAGQLISIRARRSQP